MGFKDFPFKISVHFSMYKAQTYKELRIYWQFYEAKTYLLSGYFNAKSEDLTHQFTPNNTFKKFIGNKALVV